MGKKYRSAIIIYLVLVFYRGYICRGGVYIGCMWGGVYLYVYVSRFYVAEHIFI